MTIKWQTVLFHALCLQPGGSGLVLSVLVSHEDGLLRKLQCWERCLMCNIQVRRNLIYLKTSRIIMVPAVFSTSACSAFFSISVEENWCKSNGHLSVLKDTFHSSMLVYSLANTNITRDPQTLSLCPVELQRKCVCYRVIYMD